MPAGYDISAAQSSSSAASLSGATGNQGGLNFLTRGAGSLTIDNNKSGLWLAMAVIALVAVWIIWRKN